ncbi:GNAT family N-acetyltransferase [Actinoplanes sp. TBRC 11911]|uniref:GNAT family N-acetyltransferase n=1 Tax=Actinoplanes sp. TBRC 11911 TaxID=2729386 RepID=UPI00145E56DE|nr:GNAT family N-acetyltransferase [Actinoplanes sp. TBRC 11911]NMO54030.1 GNAT family N-acetyltransferase [Actinoplanes sp. TBRC 11911]
MESLSAAEAEAVEAEFMYQYEAAMPAHDQEVLGIATRRLSGGVVLSARTDPSRYWSKALGLGFEEPVTADLIDQVLDVYRAEDNPRAVLQIAPEVLPDDWEWIARTRGLTARGRVAKFAAPIGDLAPPGTTGLRIAPVTKDDAEPWATVVRESFGFPPEGNQGLFAAACGHPQFFPYAAWDGDTIVGGANLFVHGGIASLNSDGTAAVSRGRGAQSALIAARIAKARELGCRWVVAETGQPADGESNPSYNNMLRAGLKVIYVRRNYLWRNER